MTDYDIVWMIRQLDQSLEQYGREELKDLDITLTQSLCLHYLFLQRGQKVYATQLHRRFGISKSAISATLSILRKRGYLTMENSADDDRKKQIVLTQKAFAVQGRIEEEICSQQKRMCRSISESELEAVEAVLIRMLDNMRQDRAKGGKNDGQEDIKYD